MSRYTFEIKGEYVSVLRPMLDTLDKKGYEYRLRLRKPAECVVPEGDIDEKTLAEIKLVTGIRLTKVE